MAINFPASPAFGQKHPASPVVGLPTYTWDGEKWTTTTSTITPPDLGFVLKAGDTMTGDLTVRKTDPSFVLNKTVAVSGLWVGGAFNGLDRWWANFGDGTAETGSNVGSNFDLSRYADNGDYLGSPLTINRATGKVTVGGEMSATSDIKPAVNGTINLGSATLRWGTVFTSDLDLNNGIGDWTIVEGEDELFIHNNKRGKTYKFVMVEVDPSRVPPKRA